MPKLNLDEIEAQLDSTVPYYLPALVKELREARRQLAALRASGGETPPASANRVYGSEVLCPDCAEVFCPDGEQLHFHHDGCPACAMHGEGPKTPPASAPTLAAIDSALSADDILGCFDRARADVGNVADWDNYNLRVALAYKRHLLAVLHQRLPLAPSSVAGETPRPLEYLREAIDEALAIDWCDSHPIDIANEDAKDATRVDLLFERVRDRAVAGETPAPPPWQPIETAPKDGTRIIISRIERGEVWWVSLGEWSPRWGRFWDRVEPSGFSHPTHFMPLPAPPAPPAPAVEEK